jgi:hypothetical protein
LSRREFTIMMLDEQTNELVIVAQRYGTRTARGIKLGRGIIGESARPAKPTTGRAITDLSGVDYGTWSVFTQDREHVINDRDLQIAAPEAGIDERGL